MARKERLLVTGGTGFLGKRLTKRLVSQGYPVRVFVRKRSNIEPLKTLGVELVYGDLRDKGSLKKGFEGTDVVIHAAASTSGNKTECETGTVLGTRNVLESSKAHGVSKLVYISSCSVYGVADYKTNQIVTEESGLERFPWQRGNYTASKQQAEALVTEAIGRVSFPIVILRPGTMYGPGGKIYTPMIGLSLANRLFFVFGNGQLELPLVYVDNVVDAILLAMGTSSADNKIFNVVDSERITKELYIQKLIRTLYPKAHFIYVPYQLLYCLTWLQENAFALLKRPPVLTTYRLISSQKQIRYDTSKIEVTIGWRSRVTFDQAVAEIASSRQGIS
ncbi:MAG: NAD-dependent epimerase/dehydratase family protein [Gammaproteobacteria bacterium]